MGQISSDLRSYRLKSLGSRSLAAALDKAEQYRALNEPEEAESICRDILAADPAHALALRTLGLALTDMFAREWTKHFDEALRTFKKLKSEYEVVYYCGVAWERCAKAQLEHGQAHNAAHSFEKAMELFARAEEIGPKDAPEPILRWNRCVRAISEHPELLDAIDVPHTHEFQHGD